jgi:hypothetical protein
MRIPFVRYICKQLRAVFIALRRRNAEPRQMRSRCIDQLGTLANITGSRVNAASIASLLGRL